MGHRIALEQIEIAEPCHASWEAMTGDQQKRFCDACSKHVHDLSTMTREDAEALVNRGESVCIRMQRDAGGSVRTRQVPAPFATMAPTHPHVLQPTRWFRYAASVAAMLGITSLFQGGCKPMDKTIQGTPLPPQTPNVRTMGIVAMPEPLPAEPKHKMREVAPLQDSIAPSTPPMQPAFEMGDWAAPSTQPAEPMLMGEVVAPATQPTVRPMVLGQIAAPATQPSNQAATQPPEELIKMGKVSPATSIPATQPTSDTTWWHEAPNHANDLPLVPSDD